MWAVPFGFQRVYPRLGWWDGGAEVPWLGGDGARVNDAESWLASEREADLNLSSSPSPERADQYSFSLAGAASKGSSAPA
eukprot:2883181-Pyramimonas_sp.AAC.1